MPTCQNLATTIMQEPGAMKLKGYAPLLCTAQGLDDLQVARVAGQHMQRPVRQAGLYTKAKRLQNWAVRTSLSSTT